MPEYRLELWPGYITSIARYERDIYLQAEISYKVLRKDTAYDLIRECSRGRDFRVNIFATIFIFELFKNNRIIFHLFQDCLQCSYDGSDSYDQLQ